MELAGDSNSNLLFTRQRAILYRVVVRSVLAAQVREVVWHACFCHAEWRQVE
jgi:hypothetical protein